MKMNKKGFTLIELLAIIVILAIIAVITVPIILNIIDNARKGAAKSSVIGFGKAVELSYTTYQYKTQLGETYDASASKATLSVTIDSSTPKELGIDYDGDAVTGCIAKIDSGILTLENCEVSGRTEKYSYSGGKAYEGALPTQ